VQTTTDIETLRQMTLERQMSVDRQKEELFFC